MSKENGGTSKRAVSLDALYPPVIKHGNWKSMEIHSKCNFVAGKIGKINHKLVIFQLKKRLITGE